MVCVALLFWACGDSDAELHPPLEVPPQSGVEIMFEEACRSLIGMPPLVPSVGHVAVGKQGWILLVGELTYLVHEKTWLLNRGELEDTPPHGTVDPLTAILDFDRDLKKRGIDLIVVPIPVRPLVYPESVLDPAEFNDLLQVPYLAGWQEEHFDHLASNGCRAVDLTPVFIENRASDHGPVFLPTESHWTGSGMAIAGREIASAVKRQDWYNASEKKKLHQEWLTVDHTGDLAQRFIDGLRGADVMPSGLKDVELGPLRMPVRRVSINETNRLVPVETRNPESPVVIVGDSYVVFGSDSGWGLGQQLAHELGFPVDILSTNGGGANAARMNLIRAAMSDPTYLVGKKCVIWCFASRNMVGEQWFPSFFPQ